MRFLIISGMSGAGKTQAVHTLEDIGYYCIDNLPVTFLSSFARMCKNEEEKYNKVSVVVDIRSGDLLSEIGSELENVKKLGIDYEILFLEANEDVILQRYKETRRAHPLSPEGSIENGILAERDKISFLRERASKIIDTSGLLTKELRNIIKDSYGDEKSNCYLGVQIQSFGFKYGVPRDSDLVFDVRFLPNPFYVPELKKHNGTEKEVSDFVMNSEQSALFLEKLEDMLSMMIPLYDAEGKTELVVSIGCTGGKHRSVAIAEKTAAALKSKNIKTLIRHRDMNKE